MSSENVAINRMNYLRGLFAVLILLGHCSMSYSKEVFPLLIIHRFNMVSVCFFFIISGFSISYNYYNKDNYLKRFLINKALKIFLYALICEFTTRFISKMITDQCREYDISLLTDLNWYIYEIIYFYLAFYIIYRLIKNKTVRIILLTIISLIFSIATVYLSNKYSSYWTHAYHYSSLCFLWGVLLHEYYAIFEKISKKKFISSICLLLISLASCVCMKMPQGSFIGGCILHNVLGISLMTIIAIWAHYIDYTKIPIIGWFTPISAEIYLYQFCILSVIGATFMRYQRTIDSYYVVCVVFCTLVIAYFMNLINRSVFNCIFKNKNK